MGQSCYDLDKKLSLPKTDVLNAWSPELVVLLTGNGIAIGTHFISASITERLMAE